MRSGKGSKRGPFLLANKKFSYYTGRLGKGGDLPGGKKKVLHQERYPSFEGGPLGKDGIISLRRKEEEPYSSFPDFFFEGGGE